MAEEVPDRGSTQGSAGGTPRGAARGAARGPAPGPTPKPLRRETEAERLDRKFNDLLQELRVMQTGAQLTAGFLLTLPFQQRFEELDDFQVGLYLALVLLAALSTILVMAPVAVHRRLSGRFVKERVVRSAHHIVNAVICCISLLVAGMVLLIWDVVVDRFWAGVAAAGIAGVLVALLLVLPRWEDSRGR